MFTGIVDHCGVIVEIETIPHGKRLQIETQFNEMQEGESIAVDGICLTVTQIKKRNFLCDLSPETLDITTASQFKKGQLVNLERALLPTTRLGGHFVMGHIDQVGKVKTFQANGDFFVLTLTEIMQKNLPLVVEKGSIAVNGISLTINKRLNNDLSLTLIPHTLQRTNLSQLRENDEVNLEFDIMARVVNAQHLIYKTTLERHE